MKNIVRYIFLTAQRDSLFLGLAISIIFCCYIAFFLGGTALEEQKEMSLVYAAGVSRLVLVVGLIIFIAFHIRRSFENREIDLMLVRPVSRNKFIFSYWVGFSVISFFLVIFTSICIYCFTLGLYEMKPPQNLEGYLYWTFSLFLETQIIVALAMASSLILRSTIIAALFSLGFYILSRMSGFIMLIVTKPDAVTSLDRGFSGVSALLPRMDMFGKTEWIVYGIKDISEVYHFVGQAVIYCGLLLAAAMIDFKRKEF